MSGYYAVIFSNTHTGEASADYERVAVRMVELASGQPGFLGIDSVRDPSGAGITVSYWESEEAIRAWKNESEHLLAQQRGRDQWYSSFDLRVARVEREYSFEVGQ